MESLATATPRRPASLADTTIRTLPHAAAVFFRFSSPQFLAAHAALLLTVRAAYGNFSWFDLVVVAGVAAYWPVQEWVLHIYVLHWRPRVWWGRRIDPLPARAHREHHRNPWALRWVFLPVKALLVLAPISAAGWWLAMPQLSLALTGMTAVAVAALLYEWVHYLTHTHYRPRGRYYRRIWRAHRLHHFKNERYWHAFTGPMVDGWMGTDPDPRKVETSATCRDLDGAGES